MTTLPPVPPERQSFYPEPHRADQWAPAPAQASRTWFRPVMITLLSLTVLGAAIAVGLGVGQRSGTATAIVSDPAGAEINAIQADTGTCLADIPEDGIVARVVAVPCGVAHRAEVVYTVTVKDDEWPGTPSVTSSVLAECGAFIQPGGGGTGMFQPGDWEDGLRWVAWLPTEKSWASDEREGRCVVYRDADILGSFVAGTATFAN